jgi:hypothetical protein
MLLAGGGGAAQHPHQAVGFRGDAVAAPPAPQEEVLEVCVGAGGLADQLVNTSFVATEIVEFSRVGGVVPVPGKGHGLKELPRR